VYGVVGLPKVLCEFLWGACHIVGQRGRLGGSRCDAGGEQQQRASQEGRGGHERGEGRGKY